MLYEKAKKILNKFEVNNYQAYIVGGFCRDRYLKKESYDIDITTNATPNQIKKIFQNQVIKESEFGNITIIEEEQKYEITTFRKETDYKNNRHPKKITFVKTLEEDLKRRDFTMNALCLNSKNEYIDILNSRNDIKKNIIKCIGNCDKKIKEDSLRILRAIRFATILNFKLEEELIKSIIKYKKNLNTLSNTRKKEELDKIFKHPNREYGINIIKKLELEQYLNINFYEVKMSENYLIIWSQMNYENFNFTKKEKTILDKIKELKQQDLLNQETLYYNDLELILEIAPLVNVDPKKIKENYNKLVIKQKEEIKVNIDSIKTKFQVPYEIAHSLISKIEKEIVNNKLNNDLEEINNYIKGEIQ